jgi:hypothetical protein
MEKQSATGSVPQKKPVSWTNIALGAAIQTFEVSTLGQPFEVIKTHMAGRENNIIQQSIEFTYINIVIQLIVKTDWLRPLRKPISVVVYVAFIKA